ncbi:hypothetical protein NLX67_17185 [Domibacillus sp. A3M-37]|uniref:hypothetical protein n=1 Tax=Domibacillus sp. A3M-37 TaxID=2962037 RepID=UPI0020B69A62|nr:hypothetical protein [Domibacillus sp. A3M-37]MCP3764088.1 hypothetical protein [Domibacillus sp. A3M-37]
MWDQKEKIIMVCPFYQEEMQETDHVGITQIHSIVHLYCGAWPRPGEHVIEEGQFENIAKKFL